MLDRLMKVAVAGFFELIDDGRVDPASIDWMVCHYSSHHFREQIFDLLARAGVEIPEKRWFSNLYEKGNVGSASIFVLLEELLHEGRVQPGQKVMCVVPESGGFIAGYALLTAVGESVQRQPSRAPIETTSSPAPRLSLGEGALQQRLVRQLTRVWVDFEQKLSQVPIVARLESGQLTLEDYRSLLLNLRQQVVEGSRWIARAASNVDGAALSLRPLFLQHARDEQQDYQMLERDFVSLGGSREAIRSAAKNIGSEALSAWMFHRASQPNPLDLLGAMFIIEGLGPVSLMTGGSGSMNSSGWARSR
jgi:3-oxoacyl-[acyl-carrier-protein] synthase-3